MIPDDAIAWAEESLKLEEDVGDSYAAYVRMSSTSRVVIGIPPELHPDEMRLVK